MNPYKSSITTHVLDTSRGKPATGVTVILEAFIGKTPDSKADWKILASEKTDLDGRVRTFTHFKSESKSDSDSNKKFPEGTYRLTFEVESYFSALHLDTFYPNITVVFQIKNADEHYHVPLLLNPFGYSTYRGT